MSLYERIKELSEKANFGRLACGYYQPTAAFKAVEQHVAVYDEVDMALMVLTGPDHSPSSDNWAELIVELVNSLPSVLSALKGQEWLPIESCPRDGSSFDAWSEHGYRCTDVCWHPYREAFWSVGHPVDDVLTHWRPLPPTPEGVAL